MSTANEILVCECVYEEEEEWVGDDDDDDEDECEEGIKRDIVENIIASSTNNQRYMLLKSRKNDLIANASFSVQ